MYMHNLRLLITHCKSHVKTMIKLYILPKINICYISRIVQLTKTEYLVRLKMNNLCYRILSKIILIIYSKQENINLYQYLTLYFTFMIVTFPNRRFPLNRESVSNLYCFVMS